MGCFKATSTIWLNDIVIVFCIVHCSLKTIFFPILFMVQCACDMAVLMITAGQRTFSGQFLYMSGQLRI